MHKILTFTLLLLTTLAAMPQSHTISGSITDRVTGETLIGTTILDSHSGKGTITNNYGRFSLTLPDGQVTLVIRYVGYKPYQDTFQLSANRVLNVALDPSIELEEVVVIGEKINGVRSSQVSAVDIPVEHIKAVPVLFGETDILKVVQLMPGVQSGTEGMSGIYVRGGGPDENLFLLDGVSLYNVNHLGGFFSAFNSDAIKNVTLYKGCFPAHFGGRLSSVLDVTTNNGNDKEYHGNASIGLISAKLSLEGPIIKEKTTFSVSLRRTYMDLLTRPLLSMISSMEGKGKATGGYFFYDFNGKVTHKFSDKSRLFASYYMGDDRIFSRVKYKDLSYNGDYDRENMNMGYNWGNVVASLRWNYELNPQLFMNLSTSYTRYRNDISIGLETEGSVEGHQYNEEEKMTYKSGIRDITARADFDYAPSPEHAVMFGGDFTHHIFTPEVMSIHYKDSYFPEDNMDSTITPGGGRMHANELNAYIEDDWAINDVVKLNAGLHISTFAVQDTLYPSLQPRVSGRMILTDNLSLKAGYAYMTQYMHLLSNSNISLPTDLWVPVTQRVQPMGAHQVAAGLFYKWHDLVDLSVEGYYKHMNNLLEYRDGASFWNSSRGWENKVVMGQGWSYGIEFLAQKNVGKWTGWVAYTWSKSMRLFDRQGMELNNSEAFPAKYDRRHNISIVLIYKKSDRFDISATWVYNTGNATTLAMQYFEDDMQAWQQNSDGYEHYSSQSTPYIEHRNNYRMPDYHRMDIAMNFHKQKKHGIRTWNISIYNVYNRKNPFLIYTGYNSFFGEYSNRKQLLKLSLFPIIPSFSWSFQF